MDATVSLTELASLLSTESRIRILEALLDGKPRSATELGMISGVQFNTTSSHLAKLVEAGLAVCERDGRHRFYRLAGPRVIDIVEALNELLPGEGVCSDRPLGPMESARTCYDHLAGRLGTALTDALVAKGCLVANGKDFALTNAGEKIFSDFGVDVADVRGERRMFARRCLDWTDKRDHLGGALGAALFHRSLGQGWIRLGPERRLVELTAEGREAFRSILGAEAI